MTNLEAMLEEYFQGLWTVNEVIEASRKPEVAAETRKSVLEYMLLDWITAPCENDEERSRCQKWAGVLQAELEQ